MLASKCVKCGKHFVGWSLAVPENQKCRYCGSKLAIHDETVDLAIDYEDLYKSLYDHPDEWQQLLRNTMAVHFREGLPYTASAN